MALNPHWLADKSVLARLHWKPVADRLKPLLTQGLLATSPIIDLEVLYSARSFGDYQEILEERGALPSYPVNQQVTDRAMEVQQHLARIGQHRVPIPDLLIAAVAEINRLPLIHYDRDFDRIAEITHQPCQWIVPRGSI